MARHLNDVKLIGNLTRDPELEYTPNDTAVCKFGLAVNRSYQDSSGEWQHDTTFVDVTVWGKNGGNASQYLEKGSKIFIDGRLDFDSWETDDGQRRSKLSVVAENVIFLDSNGGDSEATAEEVLDDFDGGGDEDGSIPF